MSLYLGNQKVTPTVVYKDNKKLTQLVDGSVSVLTAEDLKGITSIRNYAFNYCSKLTSIIIPDSVISIGNYAFYECTGLTSVIIPNSLTSIGKSVFQHCSRLTSVTIPDSVTSIGREAFSGCSGLTSVTIGNGVTSISGYMFSSCTGLTSVTIPDNVTSIEGYAFYNCSRIKNIYITDLAAWCKISGLKNLMIYGSNEKNLYLDGELVTNLTIPDSVTSIGSYAFYKIGLTSVTIGSGVTSIGDKAFSGCSSLTSITMLPTNPPTLGSDAIPSNVTTIIVPAGTGDAYKAATNWSAFADKIQEAAA